MKLNISERIPPPPDRSKKNQEPEEDYSFDEYPVVNPNIGLKRQPSEKENVSQIRSKDAKSDQSDQYETLTPSKSGSMLTETTPSGWIDVNLEDLEKSDSGVTKKVSKKKDKAA